ncbi:acyl carrier protein [Bordetella bronchialis]|uniref:Acyl carrier protein n=1 Tax=Bordetella bronchialis TaxID=463025 RepID=A0A193FV85_9BORD|nr:acyl carrier protein [Bordetella bronchialis]ANN66593.1 acyl carrier protein [Bordetella bronchialis]ANN71672.1 acyl carrier protein [Bordetella bronchialis]
MQTREDIFSVLREALVELFEIPAERVVPSAHLYTDLEIDSIDAIDLLDHIKRETGYKLAAENFRAVRTVQDVVDAVWEQQKQLQQRESAA